MDPTTKQAQGLENCVRRPTGAYAFIVGRLLRQKAWTCDRYQHFFGTTTATKNAELQFDIRARETFHGISKQGCVDFSWGIINMH